jgi:hypothetical protein
MVELERWETYNQDKIKDLGRRISNVFRGYIKQ